MKSTSQSTNIFQEIQSKFSIVDVARDLGIIVKKVGSSYRANCIDGTGRGENSLHFHENTNTWYDYCTQTSGDITDLVATVRFSGDKKQAIQYLMPDWNSGRISEDLRQKNDFMRSIEHMHSNIFDTSKKHCVRALDYLHSRRITDDTIRELKIGVDPSCGEFRILFPFWDECRKNILFYTTRRYDWQGNGENEDKPKYKYASLEYNPFLRSAPLGLDTLNRKKNDTLIITEGIFDWLAFYQEGYSVLAFKDKKHWKSVLEHIKDFSHVILAYDSDTQGQTYTYNAAEVLLKNRIPFSVAPLLTKDVAEHYQMTGNLDAIFSSLRLGLNWFVQYIIPEKPYEELTVGEREKAINKCKLFIKDIAVYADNADVHTILINLRKYFPKDLVAGLFQIAKSGPAQTEIRDRVRLSHDIMFNPRTGFYEYQNINPNNRGHGIWKQVDDETIMGYIADKLGKFATGSKLSSILKLVKADADVHSDVPVKKFNTLPVISVINGTLHIDLDTGNVVLKEHSMYDYCTVQLPVYYDPNAKCVKWREFLDTITDGKKDDQAVLQEFSGYIFFPRCKYQSALMLKGGGSNGKSVFFDIIKTILGDTGDDGRGYVSSTDPSKWAKDFRLMPLRHSWVNISYDMEGDMRGAEGVFKKVTAGETLEDSYKHKDPISFSPRSKLMMACNFFPLVNDTSDGFMRRWLIVELPMHFTKKEKVRPFTNDRVLDTSLEDKLMKELPGILNWMLEGLQRLIKQDGFTHTANQDRLIKEFRIANNPLYAFVEEKQNDIEGNDEGRVIPKYNIFIMYSEWAEKNKTLPLPSNRFYSNIRSVFNNLSFSFSEYENDWIFFKREVA